MTQARFCVKYNIKIVEKKFKNFPLYGSILSSEKAFLLLVP